jgi:hypothetical protein
VAIDQVYGHGPWVHDVADCSLPSVARSRTQIQFHEAVQSNLIVVVDSMMDDQGSCLPAAVVHSPLTAAP